MHYEVERASDKAGEPSIEEMTKKAIEILQKNPKGYFLLVEGLLSFALIVSPWYGFLLCVKNCLRLIGNFPRNAVMSRTKHH